MNRLLNAALLFIALAAIVLSCAACFESPTAPSKNEKKPLMLLNPDLQGIA